MPNGTLERGSGVVTPRLIVGLAIATFGVVLVLDRLNLAVAAQVLRFWPAVVIAVGALVYAQSRPFGSGANGIVIMSIGGWLLLNSLGVLRVRFWEMFWPVMMIGIGSALVAQTVRRRSREAAGISADDTVALFAILSGAKRVSASPRFRGGEVTAFMGGCQIDLSQATIPRGEEAILDVFAVIGGGEIVVPPSWAVVNSRVPIMGGVEDKRVPALPASDPGAGEPPRLVLRGMLIMGGLHITN
jgi:predicted membrane protein